MKWVYKPGHPKANERGFVKAEDLGWEPQMALHSNIMIDRFYEGAKAPDGTDIGSRRKHRAYMKEHGLTTADDFTQTWAKAEAERVRVKQEGRMPQSRERREALERAMYRIAKP